jgi:hypothetical protein
MALEAITLVGILIRNGREAGNNVKALEAR